MIEPGERVFCSWSGGKDSALALHEAVRAGAKPELLVTMMIESGERSRSHGLTRRVLEAQAGSLGLPIRFGSASWDSYEAEMLELVGGAVRDFGVSTGIFGDIDIESHLGWVESVCEKSRAKASLPLWKRDRRQVMKDVLEQGFRPMIVAVRDGLLDESLLGRVIDDEVLGEFEAAGIDLAGEEGEYHSLVIDGPLFGHPLMPVLGEKSLHDGVWFTDVAIGET